MFQVLLLNDCCPLDTELTDIPATVCQEFFGQIQRIFFVRKGNVIWDLVTNTNNVPVGIVGVDPDVSTGWTFLFGTTGDDKVIRTPLTASATSISGGDPITQGGGDDTTLNGETLINGFNPVDLSVRFDGLTGAQIAAFRKLICEGELEAYFINSEGRIWGQKNGDLFTGFCLTNVVLSPTVVTGFTVRDNNTLTAQLPFNWDETKHAIETVAAFNPLTI